MKQLLLLLVAVMGVAFGAEHRHPPASLTIKKIPNSLLHGETGPIKQTELQACDSAAVLAAIETDLYERIMCKRRDSHLMQFIDDDHGARWMFGKNQYIYIEDHK